MRSHRTLLLWLTAVATTVAAACSDPGSGSDGAQGADADAGDSGEVDGASPDATLPPADAGDAADANRDNDGSGLSDATDAKADASQDAADGDSSDAADGGDEADATDAPDGGDESDAADATDEADAADSSAGGGDAADGDAADAADDADAADAGARWVITTCISEPSNIFSGTYIDSDGNIYYTGSYPDLQQPGSPVRLPPSTYQLTAAQRDALLAAVRALDVSDAGYTTTIGPATHGNATTGSLRSAGALGGTPVLVRSLEDGIGFGHRKIVLSNDPAVPAFQPYDCFSRL